MTGESVSLVTQIVGKVPGIVCKSPAHTVTPLVSSKESSGVKNRGALDWGKSGDQMGTWQVARGPISMLTKGVTGYVRVGRRCGSLLSGRCFSGRSVPEEVGDTGATWNPGREGGSEHGG